MKNFVIPMFKLVVILVVCYALVCGIFAIDDALAIAEPVATIKLDEIYPLTTVVVSVDAENDVVTCIDYNGNLWEFYGCEDWEQGDIASLLMKNCGTAEIFDDEIIMANYCGTFES